MTGRHFDTFEEYHQSILEWRNIEKVCLFCGGAGWRTYGSTATWRGGIAGHSMTNDVCDYCWGSGDEIHHWTNLRTVERRVSEQIDLAKQNLLEKMIGSEHYKNELFLQLCEALEKETRKRSVEHDYKFMVRRLINNLKDKGRKEK